LITETLIGEASVGEDVEEAHVELAIGPKGGPIDYAFTNALSTPRKGHMALLAVLKPNLQPKPSTLMVNKVTLRNEEQAKIVFGPVQAAIAKAVTDSVEEGIISKEEANKTLIIASIFVHSHAQNKKILFENNYKATKLALKRAIDYEPSIEEVLSRKDKVNHPLA
jgi:5,6,7,8-tetrahydromethanopterin hydro-lyase